MSQYTRAGVVGGLTLLAGYGLYQFFKSDKKPSSDTPSRVFDTTLTPSLPPPVPVDTNVPRPLQSRDVQVVPTGQRRTFRFNRSDFQPAIDPRLLRFEERPRFTTTQQRRTTPVALPQGQVDNIDELLEDALRQLSASTESVFSGRQQRFLPIEEEELGSSALVVRQRQQRREIQDLTLTRSTQPKRPSAPTFDFPRINLRELFGDGPITVSFRVQPTTRLSVVPQILDGQPADLQALVPSRHPQSASSRAPTLLVVISSENASIATQIDLSRLVVNMDDQEEIGEDRALLPFTGNSSAQLPLSLQDDRQPQDFTVIFDSPDLLQALFAQFSQSMFREEPVDLFGERSVVQLLPPGSVPQEDRAPRFASLSLLSQRPSDVEDEFPVFVESDILPGHVVVSSNVAHTLPRPGFTRVPIVEVDSDDEEEVPPTNVLPSSEQQRLTVGLQDDEEDIVALLSSIHSPAARQELDVTEGFEDVVMLREQIPQSKTVHPSPLPLSRSEQVAPFDEVDYDPDFDVRSLPLRVRKHRSTSLSPAPHFKRDEDDVYSVRSYASTTTAHKKRTGPSLHAVNMSIIERNAERERQRSQKSGKGLAGVVDGIIKKRTDKDLK